MNVTTFLTRVNYALRGTNEDAPAVGDDEAIYWVDLLNRKKDELYQDVSKNWRDAYEVRSLGAVSASATPSYNLATDFIALSGDESTGQGSGGGVYIITNGSQRVDINVVNPEERNPNLRAAFIAGRNPQKLYITNAILASENIIGGTLYAPGYYMPADVSLGADVVPLPDPNWGVMAVASEVAFNDIEYEDKAPDINDKANALYLQMVSKNAGILHNSPKAIKTNIARIQGTNKG